MSTTLAYSITDAAKAASLSRSHLERAIKEGLLKTKRSNVNDKGEPVGKYVILARDLEAYLNALPEG